MDIRLVIRFLFLAFCFLFSFNASAKWVYTEYGSFNGWHHGSSCSSVIASKPPTAHNGRKAAYVLFSHANNNQINGKLVWCNIGVYYWNASPCPDEYPVYPSTQCPPPKPSCTETEILDPTTNTCVPAPKCPEAGTKEKSNYGPPNLLGYSACSSNNCIIQVGATGDILLCTGAGTPSESCNYTTYYTGAACKFNPDNTTWNPPGHEWPDVPKPDLPSTGQPDTPLPETGGNGGYDPDAGKDDNFVPPNPDTNPDTDNPNLGAVGNDGVVNELNSSNKSLQNIESILAQTRRDQNKHAETQERYNSGILGAINSIDKAISASSGSGGGSGGEGEGGSGCDPSKEQCEDGLNFGRPEVTDPFKTILDSSDIAELKANTTDVKNSITSKIEEFKKLVTTPKYEVGGTVAGVEFNLTHSSGNIQVKNDSLTRISPDIANILILVVSVICFGIVASRR